MRRGFIILYFLSCFGAAVVAQGVGDEFTIRQLLQKYTETYGGLREANRLASISIEGVQIQRGVEFGFQLRKKRPSSIRYQLERGDTTITSIYNGNQAWLQTKQGSESTTEELSGASLETLKREARFESPLYRHLEKPENTIRLEGREQVGGNYAFVLRVAEPQSLPSLYYLHPENAQILRIDRLNAEGRVSLQILYRDYREVSGYPFAYEVETRMDGETISLTRLEKVLVNPGLLSFYFEKPDK
ncbi:hypothetical protein DDZ13_12865 [Coraliomargarita sinensis]|uniref:Outer membrane lipoprotein-sorting protein n=1 Tax=Coraliomargarita sinensis TaxID=2174842 RepID=A0A317ZH60_9BACT|nr:DUF4292 domain-containing protein [Coraliomargarita sinensis]PXA03308.1 hypothetical protein DDZ13_12865 [Coraliomargarita sinensis]